MACNCGKATKLYFANIQLYSERGNVLPGGAGFPIGQVDVEVCPECGKASFVIPKEMRERFPALSSSR
jgi:hypothetical protein